MIAAADAARLRVVRLFGPHARTLLVSRDFRVAWTGALLVTSAFVMTGLLPMWVLALGPIVWGVPHVLADLRYLVALPGYHRRLAVAAPVLLGIGLGWSGLGLAGALGGASLAVLLAEGSRARRAGLAISLAALACVAHRAPALSTLVFAHAHNAIALVFFVAWRRRESRAPLFPAVLALLLAVAILGGALDPALARARSIGTATFDDLVATLAPAELCADPVVAARLVLLYGFGQSVHYVVWLRLVPEESRERPRSFRQSARALRRDLGLPILVASGIVAVLVMAWAVVDLAEARFRYLQLAFFHGWLEIAAGAVMLAEARRRA